MSNSILASSAQRMRHSPVGPRYLNTLSASPQVISSRTTTPPMSFTDDGSSPFPPIPFSKDSTGMSPVTPSCSPDQGRYSPPWQLPASPSSLVETGQDNIDMVISTKSTPFVSDLGIATPTPSHFAVKRPPRKSSLSRQSTPFFLKETSEAPAVPALPASLMPNRPPNRPRNRQILYSEPDSYIKKSSSAESMSNNDTMHSGYNADRSSLMSKASSVFDPRKHDEDVFTVEDAIKMYEDGFSDDSLSTSSRRQNIGVRRDLSPSSALRPPAERNNNLRKSRSAESMRPVSNLLFDSECIQKRSQTGQAYTTTLPTGSPLKTGSQGLNHIGRPLTGRRLVGTPMNHNTPVTPSTATTFRPGALKLPATARAATMPNGIRRRSIIKIDLSDISFNSSATPNSEWDRYGFRKESGNITMAEYNTWDSQYSQYLQRRRTKWCSLMKAYGLASEKPTGFPPVNDVVKRYIRKGLPPDWRGNAWFWYAGGPQRMLKLSGVYDRLVAECKSYEHEDTASEPSSPRSSTVQSYMVDRDHIERDLQRTFPDNILFKSSECSDTSLTNVSLGDLDDKESSTIDIEKLTEETPIVKALRRVLRAFALHKPSIGYCQSLNFLAGLLLIFLDGDEEKVFVMLDIITTDHLPGTHARVLEASVDVGVLMDLIKKELPAMWSQIDESCPYTPNKAASIRSVSTVSRFRRKMNPAGSMSLQRLQQKFSSAKTAIDQSSDELPTISLATTSWFMSLFVGSLPIESVLRVWDSFFLEGATALFRTALALFQACETKIHGVDDRMEIFQLLQSVPRSFIDANQLMENSWKRRGGFGRVSSSAIQDRRNQRRRVVRTENEARLDTSSAAPSRSHSPLGSPKMTDVVPPLPTTIPSFPGRSTTLRSPKATLKTSQPSDFFKRQATFS